MTNYPEHFPATASAGSYRPGGPIRRHRGKRDSCLFDWVASVVGLDPTEIACQSPPLDRERRARYWRPLSVAVAPVATAGKWSATHSGRLLGDAESSAQPTDRERIARYQSPKEHHLPARSVL